VIIQPPGRPAESNVSAAAPGEVRSADALVPTIFHEPWWLATASDGRYEEVQEFADGRCVGRLPYLRTRRLGLTMIGLPTLTHFLGPAIDEGPGSQTHRQIKRITIMHALAAKLPPAAALWMKCHRGITDILGLQKAGYFNGVQFTAEIGPAPEKVLWQALRDTHRRAIRRAGEQFGVIEIDDPDRFMAFYLRNLNTRNVRNAYDMRLCKATIAESRRRGAGRLLAAMDAEGEMAAAIFTVWDGAAEYYLMTTRRPDAGSGAVALLIWQSVLHASARGLVFDLDGFSNAGDIQFFTRFGGTIRPRYFVQRVSPLFRLVNAIRKID
jgi:hypothetical protein